MRIERLDETTRKNLLEDLLKRSPNSYGTYEASVREILDEVKNRRDEAVFAYTEKFDGAALNADNIQVTERRDSKSLFPGGFLSSECHPKITEKYRILSCKTDAVQLV